MVEFTSSRHDNNTTRVWQQLLPSRGKLETATGSHKSNRAGKGWFSSKSFFIVVILAAIVHCQYNLIQLLPSVLSRSPISCSSSGSSLVRRANEQQNFYNICAITRIRNDYLYIREWIEYHEILDVDQFFIADDNQINIIVLIEMKVNAI